MFTCVLQGSLRYNGKFRDLTDEDYQYLRLRDQHTPTIQSKSILQAESLAATDSVSQLNYNISVFIKF